MKVGILLHYNRKYNDMGDIARKNREAFCSINPQYDLFVDNTEYTCGFKYGNFAKPEFIRKHLHKCDWLMWSDSDSVFMNTDFKIESLINDDKKATFGFLLYQERFEHKYVLHSGNYILKNDEWTYKFLDAHDVLSKYADSTNEFLRDEWVLRKIYQDPVYRHGINLVKIEKLSSAPRLHQPVRYYSFYKKGFNILHYSYPLKLPQKILAMKVFEKETLKYFNSYIPTEYNEEYIEKLYNMESINEKG